jgi:hypothetical protein
MTASRKARRLREPGLLTTESQEKFLRFRQAYYDEIQPSQPTECHFLATRETEAFRRSEFVPGEK